MMFLVTGATEANYVTRFWSFLLDEHIGGEHDEYIGLSIAAKLCPTALRPEATDHEVHQL